MLPSGATSSTASCFRTLDASVAVSWQFATAATMVDRVERRFDLRPRRLAGDTAYGAVRLLKWLVDHDITPHVPVWDKSAHVAVAKLGVIGFERNPLTSGKLANYRR